MDDNDNAQPDVSEQEARVKPDVEAYEPGKAPVPKDTFPPATLGGDISGSDDADADERPEGHMGVSGDNVPVRTEFVVDSGPFIARGTQVHDSGGRIVCMVASAHSNLDVREKTAAWIAEKLSAE